MCDPQSVRPGDLLASIFRGQYGQRYVKRASLGLRVSVSSIWKMCRGLRSVSQRVASQVRASAGERYNERMKEIAALEREFAEIIEAERALARWARDVHVPRLYELVVLQGRRATLGAERRAARAAAKALAAAGKRGGGSGVTG